MKQFTIYIFLVVFFLMRPELFASPFVVRGRNFQVPATQEINFVPLRKIDLTLVGDLPLFLDLKSSQSTVKNQGQRGACTYFAATSLVESLIKKATSREFDLSEEFLAWAAKTKSKMRVLEEDSSMAVNVATIQNFGFLLEKYMPYQASWFEDGQPCAGQKEASTINRHCYSHIGPGKRNSKRIVKASNLVFETVDSSSLDILRALLRYNNPVHLSILGHREMWEQTKGTGDLFLDNKWKEECQRIPKNCGGHAVLVVGYDLQKKLFTFKNSWGSLWGRRGYGTIPFNYVDQMSDRKLITGYVDGIFTMPEDE